MRTTDPARSRGFSLVELLVAVLFTGILMAGMATVFKASLTTFATSSESLASARRNRMSMDMLYDDLNLAGMLPTSLMKWHASVTSANPPFLVVPNVAYQGTDVPGAQAQADQLCFYYDEILPYTATMDETELGTASLVNNDSPSSGTPSITFLSEEHAKRVEVGMRLLSRSTIGHPKTITNVGVSGSTAQLTLSPIEDTADPELGGNVSNVDILKGSEVLLARPGRYVRYSVQGRATDPEDPSRMVPCLIREEVAYGNAFAGTSPGYSIATVAENVRTLKVYLSVDGGQNWAGLAAGTATWDDIVTQLNDQLAKAGRPGYQKVLAGSFWFRETPLAVRLDVTTRTIRPRSEYAANPAAGTPEYREQTQSLVLIPRHFGLPYGRPLTNS